MATPKIGSNYRLDIPQSLYDEPISWVNNRSKQLFKIWEEIEGQIVNVRAMTRVMTVFYVVALLNYPKDTFYVSKKYLMELTRRLPIPCSCELPLLLNLGCKCGAFLKEQSAINKK